MGATKADVFTAEQVKLAQLAKALAHPARVAIVQMLARRGNACVCGDIVDELPLAQSTVSQHLKELKEAGLVAGEISGVQTCYCLSAEGVRFARLALGELLAEPALKPACC